MDKDWVYLVFASDVDDSRIKAAFGSYPEEKEHKKPCGIEA